MLGKRLCLAIFFFLASSAALTQTYMDPVPYCKGVGTIDKADARSTGPKLPAWIAEELNLKPDQGKFMEWRCAGGEVLACLYGANIPCDSKASTSRKPTQAIVDYCRQNPDSTFVPMYVVGHASSISWACHGPQPVILRAEAIDAQGYVRAYWKAVSP